MPRFMSLLLALLIAPALSAQPAELSIEGEWNSGNGNAGDYIEIYGTPEQVICEHQSIMLWPYDPDSWYSEHTLAWRSRDTYWILISIPYVGTIFVSVTVDEFSSTSGQAVTYTHVLGSDQIVTSTGETYTKGW